MPSQKRDLPVKGPFAAWLGLVYDFEPTAETAFPCLFTFRCERNFADVDGKVFAGALGSFVGTLGNSKGFFFTSIVLFLFFWVDLLTRVVS